MALSLSNRFIFKLKQVKSDRPFLDKFEFCIRLYIKDVTVLRLKNGIIPNDIEIRKLINTREKLRYQYSKFGRTPLWASTVYGDGLTDIEEKIIFNLAKYLREYTGPFKYSVSRDVVYFYANDLKFFKEICEITKSKEDNIVKQIVITRARDTIALKNPKYKFRTFLKDGIINEGSKEALHQQLLNNKENIRLGPGLQDFLISTRYYCRSHFFIDHNEEKWLLMLHMVCPGTVRKTMPIVQAK